jgi:hypothetical protein
MRCRFRVLSPSYGKTNTHQPEDLSTRYKLSDDDGYMSFAVSPAKRQSDSPPPKCFHLMRIAFLSFFNIFNIPVKRWGGISQFACL